ncbi:hypothetical protein KR018_011660 [Drosophila ironensis]|nr:hypothetical protein KR018_011660 [Drosophila ironensis]
MTSNCSFEFDRPDEVYYSGETIKGRALLNVSSDRAVKGIYILFEGEAKVRWDEGKPQNGSGDPDKPKEYFRGKQVYLKHKTEVGGSGQLTAGIHTYNFSIPLPQECPSSMVMEFGKISYVISLVIDREDPFNNLFQYPLTVLQNYNLNSSPMLSTPLVHEDIKYFCCWLCRSGPVLSTFTIPFGGYAPGQKIQYTMEIDNQSTYDLDGFEVHLKQHFKFKSQTPQHKEREQENHLSDSLQGQQVLRLTKRIIQGTLDIPAVPPSSRNEGLITVSYQVSVCIAMGEGHLDSEFDVPIIVGTIPLGRGIEDPRDAALWVPRTPETPYGSPEDIPFQSDSGGTPPSYDHCSESLKE